LNIMAITIAQPGLKQGNSDALELFLKNTAVDVIAALERNTVTKDRFMTRTITQGKSAAFPVSGRASAAYLTPGNSLDAQLQNIAVGELVILIDGLLTASALITDLDDAMAHWDVAQEYAKQLGEALAISRDAGMLAEIAKMIVAGTANLTGLGLPAIVNTTVATGTSLISATMGQYYLDMLLEMQYNLDKNYVPRTERTAFLAPEVNAALVAAKIVIDKDYGGSSNIQEARPERVAGFDLVTVPHLTLGGADNANAIQGGGHVFPAAYASKTKIIAAHRSAAGFLNLKEMGLEHGRRIEFQGDMMVAKMAIGMKGLRPEAAQMGTVTFS
jgi:hypothetical protein